MSDTLAEVWYHMSEATPNKSLARIYLHNAKSLDARFVQRMVCERVQKELPQQIEERDYENVRSTIHTLVDFEGWNYALTELRMTSAESHLISSKVRDAIFHIFELGAVTGLDVDPLVEFAPFEGDNFREVQEQVQQHTVVLLREQVSKGNTFFLDVESLQKGPLVVIIPQILEARKKEIRSLPEEPHFNQLFSTYYGFNIIISTRDLEKSRRALEKMCRTLGRRLKVQGKRLSFKKSIWPHTSPAIQHLLLNIARLSLAKTDTIAISAATALDEIGDSRGWNALYESGQHFSDIYVREVVSEALANIGSPKKEKQEI